MGAVRPLLEVGDHFIYGGLTNQAMDRDFVRHVIVVGISVDGQLQYRLECRTADGEWSQEVKGGPSLGSLPYDLALKLVADGVWLEPDDYETKVRLGKFRFSS